MPFELNKQVAQDWMKFSFFFAMALLLLAMPELALAQAGEGGRRIDTEFGIDQGDAQGIVTSIAAWWQLVANFAIYGGAIVAVIGILAGFSMKIIYIAVIVALVGGFGEPVLQWLLTTGGMDVIERSN